MWFTLTLWACMANPGESLGSGDHKRTLDVGGRERHYLVHVPKDYDGRKPWPVVLAFHGGGSHAEQMIEFSGLNDKADEAKFVVVYPAGTGRLPRMLTFNAGNCCGYAQAQQVDDVGFVNKLLDDLGTVLKVDEDRVFATGMSNGGLISYRLAAELSHRIAAIAPVGGPMGTDTCRPSRPVPVVHFHGIQDEFAPFAGGTGTKSLSRTHFFSVEHSIQNWVKANGCPVEPKVEKLTSKVDDGTSITRKTYGPGKQKAEVVLYEIEGAGHTWPGREPRLNFLGKTRQNLSANDVMWEFFQRHPRILETGK